MRLSRRYLDPRKNPGQVFSKQFSNSTAVIGTSAPTNIWYVPITDADVEAFKSFNRLRVVNKSDVSVGIYLNAMTDSNKEVELPSGLIALFGKDDNIKFQRLIIKNKSTVTEVPIDDIVVNVSRVN